MGKGRRKHTPPGQSKLQKPAQEAMRADHEARVKRAFCEPICLLGSYGEAGGCRFLVCGKSKQIYDVDITVSEAECTCPDFAFRHLHCKHILFVLFKVLGMPPERALSASWNILGGELTVALARWEANPQLSAAAADGLSDDECPICFERFQGEVLRCAQCQHQVHSECIRKWSRASRRRESCPLCRGADLVPRRA
jgi:hypothetical protein